MPHGMREGEIQSHSRSEHRSGYAAAAGLQGAPGDERDLSAAPRNPRHLPQTVRATQRTRAQGRLGWGPDLEVQTVREPEEGTGRAW